MKSKRKRFLVPIWCYGLSLSNNRRWLVYSAGRADVALDQFERDCDAYDTMWETRIAYTAGSRIPRSLRHHIAHPSWSIDPNYVKFRGHVREGRRAVKRWKKDPAYKLVKIVRES